MILPSRTVRISRSSAKRFLLRILFYIAISAIRLDAEEARLAAGSPKPPIDPHDPSVEYKRDDWCFLDNGVVRLGLIKSSGGGISWFSKSGSKENFINHWDRGRLVQQSYYGMEDGSLWNGKPWRWNPVQGGDWRGTASTLLELSVSPNTAYAKTLPKHWASGIDLTNTVMEQWIVLTGNVAHVRYRFSYSGNDSHPIRDQEIPAVFVQPKYKTLVTYEDAKPWSGGALRRQVPGWPNEYRAMTENWAAFIGANDFGVGVYVPAATNLTCYRFGDGERDKGACSYLAPLARFAIRPGFTFEYDLYLSFGSVNEIRTTFERIRKTVAKVP